MCLPGCFRLGSQISYLGSPLLIPSWAIFNIAGALVFWIWIVAVACYYSNIWNTGYLPFQSSKGLPLTVRFNDLRCLTTTVFDNTGGVYNATKIVNAASGYTLAVQKYQEYSPVCVKLVYLACKMADGKLGVHACHLRVEYVRVVIRNPNCSSSLGCYRALGNSSYRNEETFQGGQEVIIRSRPK